MVAIDDEGKPREVDGVYPETEFEKHLFETSAQRLEQRKATRAQSKKRRI